MKKNKSPWEFFEDIYGVVYEDDPDYKDYESEEDEEEE